MVLQHTLHPLDGSYTLAGERRPAQYGQTLEVRSPVDGSVIGAVHEFTPEEIDSILARCAADRQAWSALAHDERTGMLLRFAEALEAHAGDIAELLVMEIAKARNDARDEVERTAELVRRTANEPANRGGEVTRASAGGLTFAHRVPVGTVVAITPFHHPIHFGAGKLAAALVAGNAVVLKPATQGSLASTVMGELLVQAGAPPGIAHIVTGRGAAIGDHLVQHPRVDLIAFTGSSETARGVAYRAGMTPARLEVGGKDAAIVLADADLDFAAAAIVDGAFGYSGQRCAPGKRVLCAEPVADDLAGRIAERAARLSVGDPRRDSRITPLVDPASADHAVELIDQAVRLGAVVLCGGGRRDSLLDPVVLDHVTEHMEIAWVEPFAPVAPVLRVPHAAAAVELANRNPFGMQTAVFARDVDAAVQVALQLDAGTVVINGRPGREPDHPVYAGTKSTAVGGVHEEIQAMTRPRAIALAARPVDLTAG